LVRSELRSPFQEWSHHARQPSSPVATRGVAISAVNNLKGNRIQLDEMNNSGVEADHSRSNKHHSLIQEIARDPACAYVVPGWAGASSPSRINVDAIKNLYPFLVKKLKVW
jgi:hypothetical protein